MPSWTLFTARNDHMARCWHDVSAPLW